MIKIVVIEDLPIILEGIRVLINQINDFKVVASFSNGKEFIDNLKGLETDIVLTDIDMPIMNGIETTKNALIVNPELKFIALSMHNDTQYYYEMITAGAKGFVLKQASSQELENAIRDVYSGDSYFSKELLQNVILGMQNIENKLLTEKKEILQLSERDNQILEFLCQGLSNKELAEKLYVSVKTIENNKANLMSKTNTKNTAGLIIWAIKNKIVTV